MLLRSPAGRSREDRRELCPHPGWRKAIHLRHGLLDILRPARLPKARTSSVSCRVIGLRKESVERYARAAEPYAVHAAIDGEEAAEPNRPLRLAFGAQPPMQHDAWRAVLLNQVEYLGCCPFAVYRDDPRCLGGQREDRSEDPRLRLSVGSCCPVKADLTEERGVPQQLGETLGIKLSLCRRHAWVAFEAPDWSPGRPGGSCARTHRQTGWPRRRPHRAVQADGVRSRARCARADLGVAACDSCEEAPQLGHASLTQEASTSVAA